MQFAQESIDFSAGKAQFLVKLRLTARGFLCYDGRKFLESCLLERSILNMMFFAIVNLALLGTIGSLLIMVLADSAESRA
ncbi:MAG: hypothetical protein ACI3XU_04140 [Butyricicoccaceae bacterium]